MAMNNGMKIFTAALLISTAGTAKAVYVDATLFTPTLIGSLTAGKTYTVTTTGIADLYAAFNGGAGVPFTADGKPTYAFPAPYAPFYPSGLDYDPSAGPSTKGIGGAGKFYGALLGSFTSSPVASDYFTLGLSYSFTAGSSGNLYAVINDCPSKNGCYADNRGGFTVSLSEVAAVPEPASWALMIMGMAGIGAVIRRQRISERMISVRSVSV
jgi:hypothetical protein